MTLNLVKHFFLAFPRKDLETPWNKRTSEVVISVQRRQAVRQAVAKGGSEREVLRRLVEVLATLSLVNAAELGELTATVFKNLSCPLRGANGRGNGRSWAVLSRRSGRHQGQTRGRTRRGSRTTRSPVRAHVGGVPCAARRQP